MTDGDPPWCGGRCYGLRLAYGSLSTSVGRRRNEVVLVRAMTIETVCINRDLHVRVGLRTRGMTDADAAWRSGRGDALRVDCLWRTSAKRPRNDVALVVPVTVEPFNVYRDLHVRVGFRARGMANADATWNSRGGSGLGTSDYPCAASACWCRNDVVGMISVTIQSLGINRDLHIRVGGRTGGMTNGDSTRRACCGGRCGRCNRGRGSGCRSATATPSAAPSAGTRDRERNCSSGCRRIALERIDGGGECARSSVNECHNAG